ncbi:MAG: acyclic terpene utilization AtuA family protein [Limnohabitans sp.]
MTNIFRVGNASGFSGDRVDAAAPVVDTLIEWGGPSALFFETLGERTVALAQLEKRKNPERGFEPMLERLLEPILVKCLQHGITIIGNFGAANPPAAARLIAQLAARLGHPEARIAVVHGDDVQGLDLKAHQVYEADAGLDMGAGELIAANAYINAQPIVQAMKAGAQVVVTGRTGDPSLTLAPLIHHFNWSLTDWQRLAVGATAGHLLECGAQITGGYFYDPGYKDVPDPANIGFPIAEVHEDGSLFITKALRTGGMVTPETVKEQLLYEIHDPANYITPDVTLDFSQVTIEPAGPDRVQVLGVRGKPAPATVKVTVCFDGGWLGEGEISYAGPNCVARARKAAEVLRQRVAMRQLPVQLRLDLIGLSSVHDGNDGQLSQASTASPQDVRVRLAASGALQDDADQAAREVLALYCCGPAGGGGVRWRTTQRIRTQSYLIDPGLLQTGFTLQGAAELTA